MSQTAIRSPPPVWNNMPWSDTTPKRSFTKKTSRWCLERAACPQRSIKAAGWCSGQAGGGEEPLQTSEQSRAKLSGLKSISVFTLVHLQLNKRNSPCHVAEALERGRTKISMSQSSEGNSSAWWHVKMTGGGRRIIVKSRPAGEDPGRLKKGDSHRRLQHPSQSSSCCMFTVWMQEEQLHLPRSRKNEWQAWWFSSSATLRGSCSIIQTDELKHPEQS